MKNAPSGRRFFPRKARAGPVFATEKPLYRQ
jgi:hypothetical protein